MLSAPLPWRYFPTTGWNLLWINTRKQLVMDLSLQKHKQLSSKGIWPISGPMLPYGEMIRTYNPTVFVLCTPDSMDSRWPEESRMQKSAGADRTICFKDWNPTWLRRVRASVEVLPVTRA